MPKQTFFSLPEQKMKKIIKAAMDEFSRKGLKAASTNNIVANAGIPKGSFYQYFDDKKDLFKHICELAAQEKFRYMGNVIKDIKMPGVSVQDDAPAQAAAPVQDSAKAAQDPASAQEPADQMVMAVDFFTLLRRMFSAGIRFGQEHPEYFCIMNDLLNDIELRNEVFGEQMAKADDLFIGLIKAGIARGDIREDVDAELVLRMISALSISMGEHFIEKHGLKDISKFESYADTFINFIKSGISAHKGVSAHEGGRNPI